MSSTAGYLAAIERRKSVVLSSDELAVPEREGGPYLGRRSPGCVWAGREPLSRLAALCETQSETEA